MLRVREFFVVRRSMGFVTVSKGSDPFVCCMLKPSMCCSRPMSVLRSEHSTSLRVCAMMCDCISSIVYESYASVLSAGLDDVTRLSTDVTRLSASKRLDLVSPLAAQLVLLRVAVNVQTLHPDPLQGVYELVLPATSISGREPYCQAPCLPQLAANSPARLQR